MELNDWLAIIGAFGGLEAVRWGVTFWVNHKTNTRKEDASADSMEDENKRKQVDWLEERIAQRDAKIDALYVKLRNEQSDKLAWIHKCHESIASSNPESAHWHCPWQPAWQAYVPRARKCSNPTRPYKSSGSTL